jgi:hypothetical protein
MNHWIAAFLLYGALTVACAALYKSFRHNRKNARRIVIGAVIAGIVAINGVAWLNTEGTKAPGISKADIARTFGLEADKPYLATTYNVDTPESRFTLHGFADTKNGRVLDVDFVSHGIAHPLTIPASKVIIVQDRVNAPKMSVVISDETKKEYGKQRLAAPAPCRVQFEGVITCHRSPAFVTTPRPDLLLDDVLQDGVTRVVIRISPYMYNQLL